MKQKEQMKIYLSEYVGTTFLIMIVVRSGIMGQSLLANTLATGSGLSCFLAYSVNKLIEAD